MTSKPIWDLVFSNLKLAFKSTDVKSVKNDYLILRYFDLTKFRLKLGIPTPFYYIKDADAFEKSPEFKELKGLSKIVFLICDENPDFDIITPHIFLNENEILNSDNAEKIKSLIIKKIQDRTLLSTISPYETDAVVYGDKFFGRRMEIDKILSNESTSFVIFGSRRMGKTSLLKHLESIYNTKKFSLDVGSPNSGKAIFLSCLGVKDLTSFQELLISTLSPSHYWKDTYLKWRKKKSEEVFVQNFFKNISGRYRHGIILMLDEIDSMIESHDCEAIVNFQRRLTSVDFRFIQTGYRAVWAEMQKNEGSLWNFSEPLHIAQFNKEDSYELIERPMANMGIRLSGEAAQTIYQETGGIPNYIQHYCSVIVSQAQFNNIRIIDKKIFGIIDGSSNFNRIILSSVHQNIRSLHEKLILYFSAANRRPNFSIFQILDFCRTHKIEKILYEDLRTSVDILIKMGFVQPVGQDIYRFIAPIILKALRKRNLDRMLAETIDQLKAKE